MNPYILTTCASVELVILIYDNSCGLVDTGNVGYNAMVPGNSYTVCFRYACSLTSGVFSGVCVFDYLPIELLYFDARKVDNRVELGWATASEVNNEYFSVERSTNGKNFHQLSIIDGAGNSSERRDYGYTDYVPYVENYYQLAQHDYDGKITLSEIRYVNMKENCCIQVFDVFGRSLYIGKKKDFTPPAGVYIVYEDGRYKKYMKAK